MKIYTKVVIDMTTGETLEEEFEDHQGPVALCKGGSNKVEETEQEKALARVSMEQWNEYQTRFKPFEDEWISNIEMDEGDQANMAGQVNAGVGAAFDEKQGVVEDKIFSSGHDPSSGVFKAAATGLSKDRGTATAKATTEASQAVDDQTYIGLQQAVSMGRGEAAEATRDMTTLARDAANTAISDAHSSQAERNSMGSSIASAAGMGLAGWKNSKRSDNED